MSRALLSKKDWSVIRRMLRDVVCLRDLEWDEKTRPFVMREADDAERVLRKVASPRQLAFYLRERARRRLVARRKDGSNE